MMKITKVETYLLDIPLKQKAITDSQTKLESVEFVAVRLDTDEGISGWGFNWNYTKGTRAVQAIIDDTYAPVLIGEDPLMHKHVMKKNALYESFYRSSWCYTSRRMRG